MKFVNCILAITLLMPTITKAADLQWNRQSDWVVRPTSDQGTSNGNPAQDKYGNPVWNYEYTSDGGTLGSSTPWYSTNSSKMQWDSQWFSGTSAWAMADNTVPSIFSGWLTQHNYQWNTCPVVRWTNLTNQSLLLNIEGSFQLGWLNNEAPVNYSVPVEIALAKFDALNNSYQLLIGTTQTITRGTDMTYSFGSSTIVDFMTTVNPNDQLIFSVRGNWAYPGNEGRWVDLYDNLTYSAVPEPCSLVLLGLGSLLLRRGKK